MSSETNGSKPDLPDVPPPSGAERRQSARAPSAWGAARDALAAVRNLEALLRSASVPHRTILDLLPELRLSAGVLRDAFRDAPGTDPATGAVSSYGVRRVDDLSRLLDVAAHAGQDRGDLAGRARALADELEASADLLALLERASAPLVTEVRVGLVPRETTRMSGSASGREIVVKFDEASRDAVVTIDPYVVGSLLLLSVGWAHAAGLRSIVVRARCSPPMATLVVEAASPTDSTLPSIAMRVLPAVPPAWIAARRVADQIGAQLQVEDERWTLVLAPAAR